MLCGLVEASGDLPTLAIAACTVPLRLTGLRGRDAYRSRDAVAEVLALTALQRSA